MECFLLWNTLNRTPDCQHFTNEDCFSRRISDGKCFEDCTYMHSHRVLTSSLSLILQCKFCAQLVHSFIGSYDRLFSGRLIYS